MTCKIFLDSATTVGHSLRAACDECYEEYRKRTDNHHLMNVVNVVYGSSVTFEPYVNTRNERVIYQDLYMQGRDIVRRSFLWRRGCVDVRAKRNVCWQFDLERLRQFRWRQLTLKKDVDSMMISGFDWGRIRQFQWRQLFSGRNKSRLFFLPVCYLLLGKDGLEV